LWDRIWNAHWDRDRVRSRDIDNFLHRNWHWHIDHSLHWGRHCNLHWHSARNRHGIWSRNIIVSVHRADHGVRLRHVNIFGHNLRNWNRLINLIWGWNWSLNHSGNNHLIWHSLNDGIWLRNIDRHVNLNWDRLLDWHRARTGNIHWHLAVNHSFHWNREWNLNWCRDRLRDRHCLGHWVWSRSRNRDRILAGNFNDLLHNGNLHASLNFLHTLSSIVSITSFTCWCSHRGRRRGSISVAWGRSSGGIPIAWGRWQASHGERREVNGKERKKRERGKGNMVEKNNEQEQKTG